MIIPFTENRRRYHRIRKELRIRWEDQEVTFEGVTLDICPGGLFVISAQVVPPNISLHLEVLLDDGSVMMCRGKVAWVNLGQLDHYPPGFGVEFLDPPGGAQLMLLHNLSNYKGSSDRP